MKYEISSWNIKGMNVFLLDLIKSLRARPPSWPGWRGGRDLLLTSSLISANQRPQRSWEWLGSLRWTPNVQLFQLFTSDVTLIKCPTHYSCAFFLCVYRSWITTTSRCFMLQRLTFLILTLSWHRMKKLSANMASHMMLYCCSKRYCEYSTPQTNTHLWQMAVLNVFVLSEHLMIYMIDTGFKASHHARWTH